MWDLPRLGIKLVFPALQGILSTTGPPVKPCTWSIFSNLICLFWELPQWLSGKKSACNAGDLQESEVRSLGQEDPLEKEMATKSNILAWEIPWTKEVGGLQFIGSQKNLTWLSNYFYFWLCCVFVALRGFLLLWWVGATLHCSSGLLIAVASLIAEHGI